MHAGAKPSNACLNATSLIGFIENHVQNALTADDLNMSRYHAFKALNTLDKSREMAAEKLGPLAGGLPF